MLYMIAGAAMVVLGRFVGLFGLPQPDVDIFFWFGGGFMGPFPCP